MSVKVRFAPSPTGLLHVGNVRTALVNYLFAKKTGGHFCLRIDDTDKERSKAEYEAAIREDLAWLGLQWDSIEHQATRFARYEAAAEKLKASGRLYACYETPEELEIQRKMLAARGQPPIYQKPAPEQLAKHQKAGRKAHWRFALEPGEVSWDDLIRGHVAMKPTSMSDPVLLREDGVPVYTLASVVDDGEMHVTHVIRGEDHVSNTAVQIQLYQALGFKVPDFAHMALLKTKTGELSKREGGNDIRGLRAAGILPMAINSLLARIGTSEPVEPFPDLQPLIDRFDFKKFGRSVAHYDIHELETLHEKLLHHLPFSVVKDQLPFADEDFWNSVRDNLKTAAEARDWWNIVNEDVQAALTPEEKSFTAAASALLPPEPWDDTSYDLWIAVVKPTTPRKGKELFLPLRKALTGREDGPELKKLLPLLGRSTVYSRLNA